MVKITFFRLTNLALLISFSIFLSTQSNPSGLVSNDTAKSGCATEVRVGDDSQVGAGVSGMQPATVTPQAKNSILSLKTGYNTLKVLGLFINLIGIHYDFSKGEWLAGLGSMGVCIAFIESIYTSYWGYGLTDTHSVTQKLKSNSPSSIRVALVLAKLLGVRIYAQELKKFQNTLVALLILPHLGFLGHGLYSDYQTYVAGIKKAKCTDGSSAVTPIVDSNSVTAQINHATNHQKQLS